MACGKPSDGTIVAAHSNSSVHGKGMGTKAHDCFIAYVCYSCHSDIDQSNLTKEERDEIWNRAHRNTILYLFQNKIVN